MALTGFFILYLKSRGTIKKTPCKYSGQYPCKQIQVSKIIFKSATLNEDGSEEQELEVRFSTRNLKIDKNISMVLEILIYTHTYICMKPLRCG